VTPNTYFKEIKRTGAVEEAGGNEMGLTAAWDAKAGYVRTTLWGHERSAEWNVNGKKEKGRTNIHLHAVERHVSRETASIPELFAPRELDGKAPSQDVDELIVRGKLRKRAPAKAVARLEVYVIMVIRQHK